MVDFVADTFGVIGVGEAMDVDNEEVGVGEAEEGFDDAADEALIEEGKKLHLKSRGVKIVKKAEEEGEAETEEADAEAGGKKRPRTEVTPKKLPKSKSRPNPKPKVPRS